jgi:hypothetical protein
MITISEDIFHHPGLDIYSQMVYIVLRGQLTTEADAPEVSDVSKLGRMSEKQVIKALQKLVEVKILPNKLYRRMVGEFRDDRLSWAAKGLLHYCKVHPTINMETLLELAGESGEDEHNVRKALRELSQYGYLEEYPTWRQLVS